MRIRTLSPEPVHSIPYFRASTKGKSGTALLPFYEGVLENLPASLDALVYTGDLQGIATSQWVEQALLGAVVAEELSLLLEIASISPSRTGIILSGDFYSAPQADQRGASGDIREV